MGFFIKDDMILELRNGYTFKIKKALFCGNVWTLIRYDAPALLFNEDLTSCIDKDMDIVAVYGKGEYVSGEIVWQRDNNNMYSVILDNGSPNKFKNIKMAIWRVWRTCKDLSNSGANNRVIVSSNTFNRLISNSFEIETNSKYRGINFKIDDIIEDNLFLVKTIDKIDEYRELQAKIGSGYGKLFDKYGNELEIFENIEFIHCPNSKRRVMIYADLV